MWVNLFITISEILLFLLLFPVGYLLLLAIGAICSASKPNIHGRSPSTRFVIVIPAHNEASVIRATINRSQAIDYPTHLFSVHIIADHCSDNTAEAARHADAIVHERNEGPRTGKGAALSWLFQRILEKEQCDAVVIFDADTRVDPEFLRVMDWRLAQGDQVIQGQHIIRNPNQGWFPALTWAMFLIDNRFQNLGRSNLGWSAKNMGDSICFRVDVLLQLGWGEGLTEDYYLRHKLLLNGIRIAYEPAAIGRGEAPLTWARAPIDLAVANAGISIPMHGTNFKVDDAERIFRVNVLGMMYLFDAVIPSMVERRSGRFAGVASIAGLRGIPAAGPYSASKAAMQSFLEASRVELAPYGVGVTIVNPGFVSTPLTEKNRFRMPFLMDADEAARRIADGIEKGKRVVEFPWPMSLLMRTMRYLPDPLYDRLVARFGRRKMDMEKVKR